MADRYGAGGSGIRAGPLPAGGTLYPPAPPEHTLARTQARPPTQPHAVSGTRWGSAMAGQTGAPMYPSLVDPYHFGDDVAPASHARATDLTQRRRKNHLYDQAYSGAAAAGSAVTASGFSSIQANGNDHFLGRVVDPVTGAVYEGFGLPDQDPQLRDPAGVETYVYGTGNTARFRELTGLGAPQPIAREEFNTDPVETDMSHPFLQHKHQEGVRRRNQSILAGITFFERDGDAFQPPSEAEIAGAPAGYVGYYNTRRTKVVADAWRLRAEEDRVKQSMTRAPAANADGALVPQGITARDTPDGPAPYVVRHTDKTVTGGIAMYAPVGVAPEGYSGLMDRSEMPGWVGNLDDHDALKTRAPATHGHVVAGEHMHRVAAAPSRLVDDSDRIAEGAVRGAWDGPASAAHRIAPPTREPLHDVLDARAPNTDPGLLEGGIQYDAAPGFPHHTRRDEVTDVRAPTSSGDATQWDGLQHDRALPAPTSLRHAAHDAWEQRPVGSAVPVGTGFDGAVMDRTGQQLAPLRDETQHLPMRVAGLDGSGNPDFAQVMQHSSARFPHRTAVDEADHAWSGASAPRGDSLQMAHAQGHQHRVAPAPHRGVGDEAFGQAPRTAPGGDSAWDDGGFVQRTGAWEPRARPGGETPFGTATPGTWDGPAQYMAPAMPPRLSAEKKLMERHNVQQDLDRTHIVELNPALHPEGPGAALYDGGTIMRPQKDDTDAFGPPPEANCSAPLEAQMAAELATAAPLQTVRDRQRLLHGDARTNGCRAHTPAELQ